jgi:hypothetical protein
MKIKRQDTSIPVFSYVMDIFLFSAAFFANYIHVRTQKTKCNFQN